MNYLLRRFRDPLRDRNVLVGDPHFDEEQRQRDRMLRQAFENMGDGWEVIEIQIQDAGNDQMMELYLERIDSVLKD